MEEIGLIPRDIETGAYVFPLGTKIAYVAEGEMIPLTASAATPYLSDPRKNWQFQPMVAEVSELVLSEGLSKDEHGVLIAAYGQLTSPLIRLAIAGTPAHLGSAEFQAVYQWNLNIYNAHNSTDAATLTFYKQPSTGRPSGHQTITSLASTITKGLTDDAEKAREIHDWVSSNIWYDYDAFEGRVTRTDKSPLDTLNDKRGVCQEYADLTVVLLRAAGIPARNVYGFTLTEGDTASERIFYNFLEEAPTDHAWVEAYVDGRWIVMDPTWASINRYENGTYSTQKDDPIAQLAYFDISIRNLSIDHRYEDYSEEITTGLTLSTDTAAEWAKDSIQSAIAKGFVPADLQNNYTAVITRAEFCRMAVKFVEYHTGKNIDTILSERGLTRDPAAFTDTSDQDILAAYALGITNGTSAVTFSPNNNFTREQAATMIMNVCNVLDIGTSGTDAGYADSGSISSWAVDGVNFCYANGIMSGTGDNRFSPKGTYTRQESIVTFDRIQ